MSPLVDRSPEASADRIMVTVRTAARIHLGLVSFEPSGSLAAPGPEGSVKRVHGGVGFMVERPGIAVRVRLRQSTGEEAPQRFPRSVDSDDTRPDELEARVERIARRCEEVLGLSGVGHLFVEVLERPRPHVGLGSGTQLALAIAAASLEVARSVIGSTDPRKDDPRVLATLAARGMRSSIGIHGFMRGGLLLEAGRIESAVAGERSTDGLGTPRGIGPLVSRVPLPDAWRFVLAIPSGCGLHGREELDAFARLPGMSMELTAELTRIAVLELLPAAIEGNIDGFSAAMSRYGRLAGRPYESVLTDHPLARLIDSTTGWLESHGARGIAQSSWGPAVVACCASADEADALVARLTPGAEERKIEILTAAACNRGADVSLTRG